VARGEPFQSTTEPLTKFAPITVSVNPEALHEGIEFTMLVEDDDADAIDGGTIVNGIPSEVPPPGPMLVTFT
jgi:hypothetical protein